jgi:hypothetical protein
MPLTSLMPVWPRLRQVEAEEGVVTVLFQVAEADDAVDVVTVELAVAVGAGRGREFGALVVVLGDEVDHAGDRVRAVHGRGAILEHFDAGDGRHRNAVQVVDGRLALVRVGVGGGGDAAAVQQDQGRRGTEVAQRCGRHAFREAVVVEGVVRGTRAEGRDRVQQFGDGVGAGGGDFLGGHHGDRRGIFLVGALDVGTGHEDLLDRLFSLGEDETGAARVRATARTLCFTASCLVKISPMLSTGSSKSSWDSLGSFFI